MSVPIAIDQPITVIRGSTLEISWIFQDELNAAWNYNNYEIKIEVRRKPGNTGIPLLSASLSTGQIQILPLGELKLTIPADDILALTIRGESMEFWWDMDLINNNVVPAKIYKPFLPSTFTVIQEVTI